MTSRPVIGRTRIGLLNTMFSASSSPTWAAVGLPDSRSFRKGCIVIPPIGAFQGRMSGRHLKLRVFILHYLRPLRTSAKDTAFQMIALFIASANLIYSVAPLPEGLVPIPLKKASTDGTTGVARAPLAPVRAGPQRAPTAVPHREVRGSAGPGEPVEVASRAAASPSRRRERRAG